MSQPDRSDCPSLEGENLNFYTVGRGAGAIAGDTEGFTPGLLNFSMEPFLKNSEFEIPDPEMWGGPD